MNAAAPGTSTGQVAALNLSASSCVVLLPSFDDKSLHQKVFAKKILSSVIALLDLEQPFSQYNAFVTLQ